MIINPVDIGADFDSYSRSNKDLVNSKQQNQNQISNSQHETKDNGSESQDSEDPQYLADLNLFMNSTKEKSEDEL